MFKVQDFLRFGDFLLSSFVENQQGGVTSFATTGGAESKATSKWLQNSGSLPRQSSSCLPSPLLGSEKLEKEVQILKTMKAELEKKNQQCDTEKTQLEAELKEKQQTVTDDVQKFTEAKQKAERELSEFKIERDKKFATLEDIVQQQKLELASLQQEQKNFKICQADTLDIIQKKEALEVQVEDLKRALTEEMKNGKDLKDELQKEKRNKNLATSGKKEQDILIKQIIAENKKLEEENKQIKKTKEEDLKNLEIFKEKLNKKQLENDALSKTLNENQELLKTFADEEDKRKKSDQKRAQENLEKEKKENEIRKLNEDLQEKNIKLEQDLKKKEEEKEAKIQSLKKVRKTNKKLNEQLARETQEINKIQRLFEEEKKNKSFAGEKEKQQEILLKEEENKKITLEKEKLEEENKKIKLEKAELQKENNQIKINEEKFRKCEEDGKLKQEKVTQLQNLLSTLQQEQKNKEDEKKIQELLKEENKKLKENVDEKNLEVENLKKRLEEKEETFRNLKHEKKEVQDLIDVKEEKIRQCEKDGKSKQERVSQLEALLETSKFQKDQALKTLEEEIKTAQKEAEKEKENTRTCVANLKIEEEKTQNCTQQLKSLQADVKKKEDELEKNTVNDIAIVKELIVRLPSLKDLANSTKLDTKFDDLTEVLKVFQKALETNGEKLEAAQKSNFYKSLHEKMERLLNFYRDANFSNINYIKMLKDRGAESENSLTDFWRKINLANDFIMKKFRTPSQADFQKNAEILIWTQENLLRNVIFAFAFLTRAVRGFLIYLICVVDFARLEMAKEKWKQMKTNLEAKDYRESETKQENITNYLEFYYWHQSTKKGGEKKFTKEEGNKFGNLIDAFDSKRDRMCNKKEIQQAMDLIKNTDLEANVQKDLKTITSFPSFEGAWENAFHLWKIMPELEANFNSWVAFIEEVSKVRIFVILNDKINTKKDRCNRSFYRNFFLEEKNGKIEKVPTNCPSTSKSYTSPPKSVTEDKTTSYLLAHPKIQEKKRNIGIPAVRSFYGPFFEVFEDFSNKEIYCGGKLDFVSSSSSLSPPLPSLPPPPPSSSTSSLPSSSSIVTLSPSEVEKKSGLGSTPLTCLDSKYSSIDGILPLDLTVNTNGIARIMKLILAGKQVIMCPYGYSGVGKTYITQGKFGKDKDGKEIAIPGIIQYTIAGLLALPNVTGIELKHVDFIYGRAEGKQNQQTTLLQSCVFEKKVYQSGDAPVKENYSFEGPDDPNITCKWIQTFATNMYIQEGDDSSKKLKKFLTLPILTKKTQNLNGILFDFFGKIEQFQMEVDLIKPTANNPKSSRAHTFFPFEIHMEDESVGSLYFGDLAGIENPNELRTQMTSNPNTGINSFATRGWKFSTEKGRSKTVKGKTTTAKSSIEQVSDRLAKALMKMDSSDRDTYLKKFGIPRGDLSEKKIKTALATIFDGSASVTWSNYFGDQILEGVAITESNKQLRYLLRLMQNSGEKPLIHDTSSQIIFSQKIAEYDSESSTFLIDPTKQRIWKIRPDDKRIPPPPPVGKQTCGDNNLSFYPYLVSAMNSFSAKKPEKHKSESWTIGQDTVFALLAVVAPDLNINIKNLTKAETAAVNTVRFAQSLTFGEQEVVTKPSDLRSSSPTRKTTVVPTKKRPQPYAVKKNWRVGSSSREKNLIPQKSNFKINKLALQWQKQVILELS